MFFRHGEKPSRGYGQLTCQGLNRALALPSGAAGEVRQASVSVLRRIPTSRFQTLQACGTTTVRWRRSSRLPCALAGMSGQEYGQEQRHCGPSSQADYADQGRYNRLRRLGTHLPAETRAKHHVNLYGGGVSVPSWPGNGLRQLVHRACLLRHYDHGTVPPGPRMAEWPGDHVPELTAVARKSSRESLAVHSLADFARR